MARGAGTRDGGPMAIVMRALGIGLAAVAANLLMSLGDDGESGANIGAGLAIFAALAGGGFVWALLDGLDLRGAPHRDRPGPVALLIRWALVAVGAAHMAPPQGLPELLTAMGYTVRRAR